MRIYTLNVNGFRGDKKMGTTISEQELLTNMEHLKSLAEEIIEDEKDILILEEVPHGAFTRLGGWSWSESSAYRKFLSAFSEYQIIRPRRLIPSLQCTVGLCKRNSGWEESELWISNEKNDFENKVIGIAYGEVSLLGLHMNPSEEMWELLLASCKTYRPTLVIGDFNSYEKRGSMRHMPKELRNLGYCSCIPSNVITNHRCNSSIDNIYVAEDKHIKSGYSLYVRRIAFTDHSLCGIEINELAS